MAVIVQSLLDILKIDKPVRIIYKDPPGIVISDYHKQGLSFKARASIVESLEVSPDSKFIDIYATINKNRLYDIYRQKFVTIIDLECIATDLVLLASKLIIGNREYNAREPEFIKEFIFSDGDSIIREVSFNDDGTVTIII